MVMLTLPRMIDLEFLLQPHQEYNVAQYEELGLPNFLGWKMITVPISHYLTDIFLFKRLGERTFWTWEWKG